MNKEQEELLDAAYKAFEKWYNEHSGKEDYTGYFVPDKEEFIRLIKTDDLFSEKWGLKIEEKELSTQERNEWFQIHLNGNNPFMKSDWKDFELDQQNIPTKQITLEYNNEKTYYYE